MKTIQTQHGFCAWLSRKWELLNVNWTLAWAERDHAQRAAEYAHLPHVVAQLERDVAYLRVRQAVLRSS